MSRSARRVTIVADYSSPIARQWTAGIAARGISVRVLSTVTPGAPVDDLIDSVETIARPLDSLARRLLGRRSGGGPGPPVAGRWPMLGEFRRRLTPLAVRLTARAVERAVAEHRPDLVHALRIPSEGMAAARAVGGRVPSAHLHLGKRPDLAGRFLSRPGKADQDGVGAGQRAPG